MNRKEFSVHEERISGNNWREEEAMIEGIGQIGVTVRDLERSWRFMAGC